MCACIDGNRGLISNTPTLAEGRDQLFECVLLSNHFSIISLPFRVFSSLRAINPSHMHQSMGAICRLLKLFFLKKYSIYSGTDVNMCFQWKSAKMTGESVVQWMNYLNKTMVIIRKISGRANRCNF